MRNCALALMFGALTACSSASVNICGDTDHIVRRIQGKTPKEVVGILGMPASKAYWNNDPTANFELVYVRTKV